MASKAAARALPAGSDWFSSLFGFAEGSYQDVRGLLRVAPSKPEPLLFLESAVNGKRFCVGTFETPSLGELRKQCETVHLSGLLTVTNELGDVAAKHALPENRYATFQVASQFNCLEFVGPSVTPEDGITRYVADRTQGPACSIACGPATAYRNYFAPVRGSKQSGQTKLNQIDNLADMTTLLRQCAAPGASLFTCKGGYTLADDVQLRALGAALKKAEAQGRMDELRDALRIGVHSDVQVTATDWGRRRIEDEAQRVTQIFGSACSVAYSRGGTSSWRPFASLVLQASYEATLCAALLNAHRHGGAAGSRKVFLTCLGGGVFGNSMDWIIAAMRRACSRFEGYGLDVRVVTYAGRIDPMLLALERDFEVGRRPPQLKRLPAPAAGVRRPAAGEAEGDVRKRKSAKTGPTAAEAAPCEGTPAAKDRRPDEAAAAPGAAAAAAASLATPEKRPAATAEAGAAPRGGVRKGRRGAAPDAAKGAAARAAAPALEGDVAEDARRLGYEDVLRRLVTHPSVAEARKSLGDAAALGPRAALAALEASGGLLHPARRSLLAAATAAGR